MRVDEAGKDHLVGKLLVDVHAGVPQPGLHVFDPARLQDLPVTHRDRLGLGVGSAHRVNAAGGVDCDVGHVWGLDGSEQDQGQGRHEGDDHQPDEGQNSGQIRLNFSLKVVIATIRPASASFTTAIRFHAFRTRSAGGSWTMPWPRRSRFRGGSWWSAVGRPG